MVRTHHVCRICVLAVVPFLAAVSARAATIHSTFTSWDTAVVVTETADWAGPAPGAYTTHNTSAGLNDGNVNAVGYSGASTYSLFNTNAVGSWTNWGTGALVNTGTNDNGLVKIRLNFRTAVNAFGLNLMTANLEGASVTVTVNGTDSYSVATQAKPGLTWWGVVNDTPVTFADIQAPAGHYLLLDNVSIGNGAIAELPEPASVALVGFGLVLAALLRRR